MGLGRHLAAHRRVGQCGHEGQDIAGGDVPSDCSGFLRVAQQGRDSIAKGDRRGSDGEVADLRR